MDPDRIFQRYRELQRYVGWTDADAARVRAAAPCIAPHFAELIDDFYEEILRHEATRRVISDQAQIMRLKVTLRQWIEQLFAGPYDRDYVARRWRVGLRHAELGLDQTYVNAALSRLRSGILERLCAPAADQPQPRFAAVQSINRLLDLDLAIIIDSYQAEHIERRQQAERDRLSAVLHEEREFSEGLLSKAQAVVLVLDLQGRIVRFNAYTEELCGYLLEEVQGEDWFQRYVPAEDRARIRQNFVRTIDEGETAGVAHAIVTRAGQRRRLSWSNKALNDAAGKTFAVLAIGQDITELEQAQQRALQAERLAAIGQMAAALAHEGRNALQRIQANAETLELELEDRPETLDLVARIQHAQEDLRRLFDEIRGFVAPVTLDRSECSLASVWREAWELLAPQRKRRDARLHEEVGDVDLTCVIDRFRMVQVFRNLLENSLAACRDPVEIRMRCSAAEAGGQPAIAVAVCDNGPGIAAADRQRVFEAFFTTKTRGIGLGMAIARRNVEAHGGSIEVASSSDPGAKIIVTVPKRSVSP